MPENGLIERVAGLKEDVNRLEGNVYQLSTNFDRSATKQGERIGAMEIALVELRRDFFWSMRLLAGFWAAAQAIGLVFLGWYLKRG